MKIRQKTRAASFEVKSLLYYNQTKSKLGRNPGRGRYHVSRERESCLTGTLLRPSHLHAKAADTEPTKDGEDHEEEDAVLENIEDASSEDELWENTNRR